MQQFLGGLTVTGDFRLSEEKARNAVETVKEVEKKLRRSWGMEDEIT